MRGGHGRGRRTRRIPDFSGVGSWRCANQGAVSIEATRDTLYGCGFGFDLAGLVDVYLGTKCTFAKTGVNVHYYELALCRRRRFQSDGGRSERSMIKGRQTRRHFVTWKG